jgi:hypothetical protein
VPGIRQLLRAHVNVQLHNTGYKYPALVDALGQSGDEVSEEGVPQPGLVQIGGVPGIRQLLRAHMNSYTTLVNITHVLRRSGGRYRAERR